MNGLFINFSEVVGCRQLPVGRSRRSKNELSSIVFIYGMIGGIQELFVTLG